MVAVIAAAAPCGPACSRPHLGVSRGARPALQPVPPLAVFHAVCGFQVSLLTAGVVPVRAAADPAGGPAAGAGYGGEG